MTRYDTYGHSTLDKSVPDGDVFIKNDYCLSGIQVGNKFWVLGVNRKGAIFVFMYI